MNSHSTSLIIPEDQIDLWSADLDGNEFSEEHSYRLLSPDEETRAQRFRSPLHRRRYIVRRGILRTLIGRYLDAPPESISFAYGAYGKPGLFEDQLQFNVSHSENWACFAFSKASPLGIDIELNRPIPDLLSVAASFCSSKELADLGTIRTEEQTQAFLRCWTRKEALVKALGRGLSYPLNRVCVSLDEAPRLLQVPPDQKDLHEWHFHPWNPWLAGFGALVSRRPNSKLVSRCATVL